MERMIKINCEIKDKKK